MMKTEVHTKAEPHSTAETLLLMESLEKIGARGVDMTPMVYERFFLRCPEARPLFNGKEHAVQGKMLNEILMSSADSAKHASFLHGLMTTQANDHMCWGVTVDMYAAFFDALLDVMRAVLGSDWTAETQAAWQQQCNTFVR